MHNSDTIGAVTPLQMEAHLANLARKRRLWSGGVRRLERKPAAEVLRRARVEQAADPEPWGAPINLLSPPSAQNLIRLVALKHGRRRVDVIGPARTRDIVAVRHEAVALVFTHCHHLSLPEIGRMFGNRDHTTILHALRKLGLAKRMN